MNPSVDIIANKIDVTIEPTKGASVSLEIAALAEVVISPVGIQGAPGIGGGGSVTASNGLRKVGGDIQEIPYSILPQA